MNDLASFESQSKMHIRGVLFAIAAGASFSVYGIASKLISSSTLSISNALTLTFELNFVFFLYGLGFTWIQYRKNQALYPLLPHGHIRDLTIWSLLSVLTDGTYLLILMLGAPLGELGVIQRGLSVGFLYLLERFILRHVASFKEVRGACLGLLAAGITFASQRFESSTELSADWMYAVVFLAGINCIKMVFSSRVQRVLPVGVTALWSSFPAVLVLGVALLLMQTLATDVPSLAVELSWNQLAFYAVACALVCLGFAFRQYGLQCKIPLLTDDTVRTGVALSIGFGFEFIRDHFFLSNQAWSLQRLICSFIAVSLIALAIRELTQGKEQVIPP